MIVRHYSCLEFKVISIHCYVNGVCFYSATFVDQSKNLRIIDDLGYETTKLRTKFIDMEESRTEHNCIFGYDSVQFGSNEYFGIS